MKLKDLWPGHAFKPTTVVGAPVSFKCRGISVPEVIPTVDAESYFLIPTQVMVEPIAPMENYDNGIGYQYKEGWDNLQTIDSVPPGTVCMLPGGAVSLIVKTKHKFPKRLHDTPDSWIVAGLCRPAAQQGDIEVDDLGKAGDHNGLHFYLPERVI